jgi:patatin-like phospholipase/acyl hydrolase
MSSTLLHRFNSPGPKRILTIDGGGIRGAIAVGFLRKIETILRVRHNNPDLRLHEYFDLIGGTSTGAIIAALLATGKSVDEIETLYRSLGRRIFGKKYAIWDLWSKLRANYDAEPLQVEMKNILGDITLGDERVLTGICVVAKRADTFSTWPMINHPNGKYYNAPALGQIGNKDYLLREVVRASTAAPTYFMPQLIDIGGRKAVFVDGGVSMANNPALQCFMVATLKGFPFHWKTGENNLQLVSIGTGTSTKMKDPGLVERNNLIDWASSLPDMFMDDASMLNQTILQYLSNSPTAIEIDSEIGNLDGDLIAPEPSLSYLRYQAYLERRNPGPDFSKFTDADLVDMRAMDKADNVDKLLDIGRIAADFYIQESHFGTQFNRKEAERPPA